MQIHVNKDGQSYGPFTLEQLQQYVQQGHFTAQDHAFYEGCQEWVTIAQVPGFAAAGQAAAGQTQAQQDPVQQQAQAAQAQAQAQQAQAQQQAQATPAQAQAQQAQATPAQAQAQQAQAPQGQTVQQQVSADAGVGSASKKKKIILWSSIGGVAALLVAGLFLWAPWSDDEDEKDEDKLADHTDGKGGSKADDADNLLLKRIPDNALGMATLRLDKVIQKAGAKAASLIPEDSSDQSRFLRGILVDPSSIGLDVSEPVRAYFLQHPTKPDEDPTIAVAAKMKDSAKAKQLLTSMKAPPPTATKDGYDMWEIDRGEAYFAIADGIFFFVTNSDRRAWGHQSLSQELERFMTTDGSNSLVEAHPAIRELESKGYDLGIWANLENLGSLAEGKAPDELLGLVEAGTLSGGLRFDNGEVVLELDGASKGLGKALGGGGIPSNLAKYLSADAPLLASVSMSVDGLVGLFNDTLAAETGMDLNEPIKELGIAPREVLDVFQGHFAVSLTSLDNLMGGGGSTHSTLPGSFEDESGESEPFDTPGNFGDEGNQGNAGSPPNPFADTPQRPEIAVDSVSVTDGPQIAIEEPPFGGGPPPGGPPPGMTSSMPEFAFAASIDNGKWDALMTKSPALQGILLGATLSSGLKLEAANGVLLVSSPKHASALTQGGLPNPVAAAEQSLFTSHDFALRINSKSLVKALMDEGMPPPLGQALGGLDSLAVTADSRASGGSLSVRLSFTDKRANSLPALTDFLMKFVMHQESHRHDDHPATQHEHDHGPDAKVEDFERF